jgi:hypothetical protein
MEIALLCIASSLSFEELLPFKILTSSVFDFITRNNPALFLLHFFANFYALARQQCNFAYFKSPMPLLLNAFIMNFSCWGTHPLNPF